MPQRSGTRLNRPISEVGMGRRGRPSKPLDGDPRSQALELSSVPRELSTGIRDLAEVWVASARRPRVRREVAKHWRGLIEAWIKDATVPLLVRKSGPRGSVVQHGSGRALVPVDNAPANWALSSALSDHMPSLPDVMRALESGELPVALALTASERSTAKYLGMQRVQMDPPNLNTLGWTVCHIEPVGLGTRQQLPQIPIQHLTDRMRRLLSVENTFLVPKSHAGLGELPEFLEVFGRCRSGDACHD